MQILLWIGLLLFLFYWSLQSRFRIFMLNRFVDWRITSLDQKISKELNVDDRCTYVLLKDGEVLTKWGQVRILTLQQSYVQLGGRSQVSTVYNTIFVLVANRKQTELCDFLHMRQNYRLLKKLENGELLVYQIRSIIRFWKDVNGLLQDR